MSPSLAIERFSTTAQFSLVVSGVSHRVVQVASSFIILDRPTAIRQGEADLIIEVDGERIHRRILLIGDSTANDPRIAIQRLHESS